MAAERWLSPTEGRAWMAYLTSNKMLMRALDRQLLSDSGIAHTHYAVLAQLSNKPGGSARLTQLAASMENSQSRMSHAVGRLEKNGWVRRELDPSDGRAVHVVLTEQGKEVLRGAAPGHVRCVRENLFDGLTAEQVENFREVCEIILARLSDPRQAPDELPGACEDDQDNGDVRS